MSSEVSGRSTSGQRAGEGTLSRCWRQRWFLGCVGMLVVLVAGFEVKFRNTTLRKLALPLRKSLAQLDRPKLVFQDGDKSYSYRLEGQPVQLEPEMVDKLGTHEYISWTLRLRDDTAGQPTNQAFHLFVTYYTGKPDQVPHVPEECYLGNAFREVRNWLEHVSLPSLAGKDQMADVQVLLFERQGGQLMGARQCQLVMYTFRVNDSWQAEREGVRRKLGNPFDKYAYFSKVELGFPLPPDMPEEAVKRAMQEGKRVFEVVLPLLVDEHWPIWPTSGTATQPAADGGKTGSQEAAPTH